MTFDYHDVIRRHGARAAAATAAAPLAPIPWSDDWTVGQCGQHVAKGHHGAAAVISGRPDANFTAAGAVDAPEPDDPGLAQWFAAGTAALVAALDDADPTDTCWSWWPQDTTVGFWARRMAHETLVHRWDLELGAGVSIEPMEPALAADGIDEYFGVFVHLNRFLHEAPGAGETVHVHCTDTEGEWLATFPGPGVAEVTREHAKGQLAMRGPAEGLLLHLWGRVAAEQAGVELLGDATVAQRWTQLVPPL